MKDDNFPWFKTVRMIKVYQVRDMKDKTVLQRFFTRFQHLEEMRGITEEEFDPFELFPEAGKRIPRIKWSLPDNAGCREKILNFLKYNNSQYLKIVGGSTEKIPVPTLHQQSLKHLILKDMPGMEVGPVFEDLPELQTLIIDDVEAVTKEVFVTIHHRLMQYKGLETFALDLITFELDDTKELILDILKQHADTLRYVSFSKNKVTNSFMQFICEGFGPHSKLEEINLQHLKDVKSVNWIDLLKSIA